MNPPLLVMFSGLPGTGKSSLSYTLARQLQIPLFAKDRLQAALVRQGLAHRSMVDGYRLILDLADEILSLGVSCILDGVFPLPEYRTAAKEMARRRGARFKPIYCFCSDEAAWKARMTDRRQFVPGWTPVGWDEVERIRSIFQSWDPAAVLSIDSHASFDQNYHKVLDWVRSPSL